MKKINFEKAWFSLGNILANRGEIEKAEEAYKKAIEIKPNDSKFWFHFGNLLFDNGKILKAEKAYRKALEYNPKSDFIRSNLKILLDDKHKKTKNKFHKSE